MTNMEKFLEGLEGKDLAYMQGAVNEDEIPSNPYLGDETQEGIDCADAWVEGKYMARRGMLQMIVARRMEMPNFTTEMDEIVDNMCMWHGWRRTQ